ncbi:uncharacterized protein K452DRAFT_256900 [Aplosporella prunicola CBS 121167]|uniref:Phosphoglycerate mutase n=1 Tax=Aplosporella prunicola CBS 121167 TaxID=1176127 RepID=A0A6A6B1Z0_9PEZI|nr:uncharacterized protein K452DRAFT_256900 [Aplosporella prunicola CBS 121167]KAF2138070.1 hypothetical protein K452DRAFT_256900 [Aplosporella prunicola CBS 121167]
MSPSPAVIIVARHGARLDAADKTWHLTSPTPYDPPLTYGGWTQSRALGTRIASLLYARETSEDDDTAPAGAHGRSNSLDGISGQPRSERKKRKHKVIVHSSPFLRCIQTSVAISAGISSFQHPQPPSRSRSNSPKRRASLHSTSANGRGADRSSGPKGIPHPEDYPTRNVLSKSLQKRDIDKTVLRVDAFLGEWLSPDYFDLITPPPNSTMMLAGAKAELLRRGEFVDTLPGSSLNTGNFPGGWRSTTSPGASLHQKGGSLSGLGSLAQALPLRDRASSQGSSASRSIRRGDTAISTSTKSESGAYRPPVPTYAISPAEPIPRGYVAHARDACVDIDYQWDSMRDPQQWGDGGDYGEEWSAMHKRFRGGLNKMVAWYKEHGAGDHLEDAVTETQDEEDEEDLVLVLVTHGAGCNALIGALTNQPVLLDVGMASLTMAVRKEESERRPSDLDIGDVSPLNERRKTSVESVLSDEYDLTVVASTEHLRVGADPARLGPMPSPQLMTKMSDSSRYGAQAAPASPVDNAGEPARGVSSSLGSIRRSSTVHSMSSRSYNPTPGRSSPGSPSFKPGTALWSRPTSKDEAAFDGRGSPAGDFMLNFGNTQRRASTPRTEKAEAEAEDEIAPLPPSIGRSMSQHGLWGSAPSGARNERERGPKRRWTVTERDAQP